MEKVKTARGHRVVATPDEYVYFDGEAIACMVACDGGWYINRTLQCVLGSRYLVSLSDEIEVSSFSVGDHPNPHKDRDDRHHVKPLEFHGMTAEFVAAQIHRDYAEYMQGIAKHVMLRTKRELEFGIVSVKYGRGSWDFVTIGNNWQANDYGRDLGNSKMYSHTYLDEDNSLHLVMDIHTGVVTVNFEGSRDFPRDEWDGIGEYIRQILEGRQFKS